MYRKVPEQVYRRKKLFKTYYDGDRYGGTCYVDTDKNGKEFVRYYAKRPGGFVKFMKQYNNKRIRRYKGPISNGADYRKLNEHWWIIY